MEDSLADVWKALSDGSRRKILDLLRDGPLTTGQLCARFDMSRFGVMKHLGVLESAGLVTVRRRGRQRWNHLNAVPLRQIYQRWVGRYEGLWSHGLLNLKQVAEQTQGEQDTMLKRHNGEGLDSFEIAQEVVITAPRSDVWAALTSKIGDWWAFRLTDDTATMSLDARVGGQFVEDKGDGEGAVWGTVTYLKRGEVLRLTGALGMASAPVNSMYTYELDERDGSTRVKLTHQAFGRLDPDWASTHDQGWNTLLTRYLKQYLEHGKLWRELKE